MTRSSDPRLESMRERPGRLLVVLAHPDDESYGLAGTLCRYGDDPEATVVLMTLTRGEAARAGLDAGLTPERQAEIRSDRMREVAAICRLDGLILGDAPDGRMARVDPRPIEAEVRSVVEAFRPEVLVTFGPRGINAHPDHIATHHVVMRAVLAARDRDPGAVPRIATVTVPESFAEAIPRLLFATPDDEVDVRIDVAPWAARKERCLRLHEAYVTVTDEGCEDRIYRPPVEFLNLWNETPASRPLTSLFDGLQERRLA
jgi:LmbE family N-acetylglucosaminyl deacetylase